MNLAMGGAGIATSLDAIGSSFNNVSSISYLDGSSMEFGTDLLFIDIAMTADTTDVGSSGSKGTVGSKSPVRPIPLMAFVEQTETPWTYGISLFGIGGFGVDYPANSNSNPLTLPQSSGGFGAIQSNYQVLQGTPALAYKAAPNLSLGAGLNLDIALLSVDPFTFAAPNSSGYPTGSHTSTAAGIGFTLGATYKIQPDLAAGFVFKSPQWFQPFHFNSQYPDGTATTVSLKVNYPMIIGAGFSYGSNEKAMIATDVKWLNYANTAAFSESGYAADRSVRGVGWKNIWALSLGAQYRVKPGAALRLGYSFNQNPIPSDVLVFSTTAPAILQHHFSIGAEYEFAKKRVVHLAYYHAFQNTASGPITSSGTGVVTDQISANSVSLQFQFKS